MSSVVSDQIRVSLAGGEEIIADRSSGQWKFSGVMGSDCARLIDGLRAAGPDPKLWALPEGNSIAAMLLRELILRARGEWQFPFPDHEICHCRAVTTETVDQAILSGAESAEEVSLLTTASTACGTCRPDVLAILSYRRV